MKCLIRFLSLLLSKFLYVCVLSIVATGLAFSQTPAPSGVVVDYAEALPKVFNLPEKINETSGLIFYDGGLWTFNDSGGEAELYKLDPEDGSILMTVVVNNAENIDWEEIAQDEDHMYIGDFGNNMGNRKNLRVYKISKAEIGEGERVRIGSEVIDFDYADQQEFKVKDRKNEFDCESMISFNERLILFSKNWVTGNTRMYNLPKEPGRYTIEPADEFKANGFVTGADYNPESGTLVMIGYVLTHPFLFIFPDFDGKQFLTSSPVRINLQKMGQIQTEGICFIGLSSLAISAERTRKDSQALYIVDIPTLTETVKQTP